MSAVPPQLTPFKPGQSGNPAGRKKTGAYVTEHQNSLALAMEKGDITYDDLKKIARTDPNGNRRAAALYLYRRCEDPNMKDFEPVLDGQMSLREIDAAGYDTSMIKKCKTRITPQKDGDPIVTRELELHDRALDVHKDLMDRTEGRPIPAASDLQTGNVTIIVNVQALGEPTADQPAIEQAPEGETIDVQPIAGEETTEETQ